jgi:ankyrin repeat protein
VVGGHVAIVRQLAEAGADVGLRGTGAPGFAGKTALDLALARNDSEMVDILHAAEGRRRR